MRVECTNIKNFAYFYTELALNPKFSQNLQNHTNMVITFNELRRIKDKLPSGSTKRIAEELNMAEETVRNYFGGSHLNPGLPIGVHFEKGPNGGVVTLDDTSIYDVAMRILNEQKG